MEERPYIIGADLHYRTMRKRFLYYMTEREAIRHRREEGHPFPWTSDLILRTQVFANIHRYRDRTTRYCQMHILDSRKPFREIVANTVIYRMLAGYRLYDLLGWLTDEDANVEKLADRLRPYLQRGVGIAPYHRTCYTHPRVGKADRVWGLATDIHLVLARTDSLVERFNTAKTPRELYEIARQCSGIHKATAYEIAVDFISPTKPGPSLFLDASWLERWTEINTPQVRAGLEWTSGETGEWEQKIVLLRWRNHYREIAEELDFPFDLDDELSLVDLHQCFHEFGRYMERVGHFGEMKKGFKPTTRKELLNEWSTSPETGDGR